MERINHPSPVGKLIFTLSFLTIASCDSSPNAKSAKAIEPNPLDIRIQLIQKDAAFFINENITLHVTIKNNLSKSASISNVSDSKSSKLNFSGKNNFQVSTHIPKIKVGFFEQKIHLPPGGEHHAEIELSKYLPTPVVGSWMVSLNMENGVKSNPVQFKISDTQVYLNNLSPIASNQGLFIRQAWVAKSGQKHRILLDGIVILVEHEHGTDQDRLFSIRMAEPMEKVVSLANSMAYPNDTNIHWIAFTTASQFSIVSYMDKKILTHKITKTNNTTQLVHPLLILDGNPRLPVVISYKDNGPTSIIQSILFTKDNAPGRKHQLKTSGSVQSAAMTPFSPNDLLLAYVSNDGMEKLYITKWNPAKGFHDNKLVVGTESKISELNIKMIGPTPVLAFVSNNMAHVVAWKSADLLEDQKQHRVKTIPFSPHGRILASTISNKQDLYILVDDKKKFLYRSQDKTLIQLDLKDYGTAGQFYYHSEYRQLRLLYWSNRHVWRSFALPQISGQ